MHPYEAPSSDQFEYASAADLSHCGLGIASFVLSLLSVILVFIVFGYAGYLEINTPGGIDEQSPAAVILGLVVIALCFLIFLALVLGIVSLFRKGHKKLFGIMGTIFSVFILLVVIGVIALGLSVS